jgi:medium-chain acyl-[acyl-carrier-protein] hydrolase
MQPVIPVYGIELPGHGVRLREPAPTGMAELLCELAPIVEEIARQPGVLFGHSMGALIAFEVARTLAAGPGADPVLLVVSGCQPPRRRADLPHRRGLPDDELIAELVRLGSPPEPLADPDIRRIALPILRADLTLVETFVHQLEPPLQVPLLVLAGTDDPEAPPGDAGYWSEETTGGCTAVTVEGDHFFAHSRPHAVAAALMAATAAVGHDQAASCPAASERSAPSSQTISP